MALAPRESGLHLWPHDSIGGVNERLPPPGWSRRLDARACDGRRRHPTVGLGGLLAELEWRGILQATTPGLPARLATGRPIAGYIGFDPSGASLHIGHLVPIFGLLRLQRFGGRPVALVGGGTGMIGDPSGRSTERNLLDARRSKPTSRRSAASSSGSSTSRRAPGRGHGQQPRLARRAVADRLPARHRQALHDPVHARQGLGPGPARARAVVHRVQLHAPPGVRLRPPPPDDGRRAPDGRRRPVGQHHRRARADPPDRAAAEDAAEADPAHGLAYKLLLSPSGTKFGKSESGDVGLARPGAHLAVRVLPVLAQHRRSRRRDLPALVHRAVARRDRGARGRGGARARGAGGAAGARARHHGPDARRRGRAARRSPIPRPSSRPTPIDDPAVLRSLYESRRRVHVRSGAARPAGSRSCWPRPACSPRRARRAG